MKLKICYLLFICFFTSNIKAQVGINTTTPNAQLDIRSSNQATPTNTDGILIPKVDAFPATNPTASQQGMLIYLTTTATFSSVSKQPGFYYWDNATTNWIGFQSSLNSDWSLTGNGGTNTSTNFLGTTDNVDIVFKRNNRRAAFIGDGTFDSTLNSNNGNTSFGDNSLLNPTVNIGTQTGVRNSAFGVNVMPGLTTGQRNTGVGDFALYSNTSGNENTALGVGALFSNTISSGQTAVGRNALTSFNGSNTANIGNTAVGFGALRNTATGIQNTAIGYEALRSVLGTGNVGIGYRAGFNETGANKLYIENSNADANNALIYGEFDNNIVRVNGTLQVNNPATVNGYALPNVRGTANQVLQTDGAGATNWVSTTSLSINETDPQVSSTTNNRVPRWNSTTTTLVDGTIHDDGTNVGIDVTPAAGNKLEVNGKTSTTNFQMTNGATNGYILQSDATGNASWVQNPLNTLSLVRVNLSANQALTTTGWQKATFDSEVFDTSNEFDTTTNRFTATKAGFYRVNAAFHTNNQSNNQFYSIGIRVNGNFYQQTSANHFGNGAVDRAVNCLVQLAVGDYIEVFAENYQTGVQIDGFSGKTIFEVEQIR
jgi:hypothetical protein